jgi:hypothetical protein
MMTNSDCALTPRELALLLNAEDADTEPVSILPPDFTQEPENK